MTGEIGWQDLTVELAIKEFAADYRPVAGWHNLRTQNGRRTNAEQTPNGRRKEIKDTHDHKQFKSSYKAGDTMAG